jgi:hypothetical protein
MNSASRRKSMVLAALVGLNAILVSVLVLRHAPENRAQAAGNRVGDVLAVPGQLPGFSNGVVFLLDTANPPRLSTISVDTANRNSQAIQAMPALDLAKSFNGPAPVRPR